MKITTILYFILIALGAWLLINEYFGWLIIVVIAMLILETYIQHTNQD